MARVFPFRPYRYAARAGKLDDLVTQPYDKITPEMRERYLAANPHNLVRVILGKPEPDDDDRDNVYTRAAAHFNEWLSMGILVQDPEPAFYAYFQEFTVPGTGERAVRKGFIGLGAVEDYSAEVVYRHEQTLAGPKKDRMEVLLQTEAHFGQIFMLYPDKAGAVDKLLDEAAKAEPVARVTDEYGTVHTMWKIADAARIQALMSDKKLLIADGHHRYETALAFRDRHPHLNGAKNVMMTFVNMYSPGLKILATHRLLSNYPDFDKAKLLRDAAEFFTVEPVASAEDLAKKPGTVIGAAIGDTLHALTYKAPGKHVDVKILHDVLLGKIMGITEDAVRDESFLTYVRGADKAIAAAREDACQIAFLLKPTSIEQTTEISFAGGVMPQKSTDFYPKLLTGLAIYRIEG